MTSAGALCPEAAGRSHGAAADADDLYARQDALGRLGFPRHLARSRTSLQRSILFQRQKTYGNRLWVTKEEHDKRIANAERSDKGFTTDSLNAGGTEGLANWVKSSDFSWRTSMLVKPADGQLPPLTARRRRCTRPGARVGSRARNSTGWMISTAGIAALSRGFPASMFPFRYNYGQRIWQSPGYIVIELEMLGTRVIPIGNNVAEGASPGRRPGWATAAPIGKARRWSSRPTTSSRARQRHA